MVDRTTIWPVRTERLVLRAPSPDDAEDLWAYRRLPEVSRWMTQEHPTLEALQAWMAGPGFLERTVIIERGGEVIGDLMLEIKDGWAQSEVAADAVDVQAELGWVLRPDQGGHGYATEAVEALLRVGCQELELRRVTADCFADNEASWRLMERVGMRRWAHSDRDSLHRDLGWVDGYGYALLAEDWRARHPDARP